MPQLFDAQTGAPVDNVSPEDAHAGIVSGKYGLDGDAGPVTLQGADGKIYKASPQQVAGALATNKYRMLSPDEELKHQVAQEEAAKGTIGSLKAAASSGANQLLLGIPEAITEANETPEEKAKREAAEEYHHVARFLGGAVGVGGSLAFGGELFKGLEAAGQAVEHGIVPAAEAGKAALGARLASKAANVATQGALMASPQALIQAAAGDPKKAAETLLWGIGAGAALGGAGELLSSGAGAVADSALAKLKDPKTAEFIDNWANERTLKAFGAERSQLNKLSSDRMKQLADFAHEEGLLVPGKSRQEIGDLVSAAHDKWGKEIGDSINSLDGALGIEHGKSVGKDEFGTPMFESKQYDAIDKAIKPGQLGASIKEALDSPELRMPMNSDQAAALDTVIQSADKIPTTKINGRDVVTFEDAQNFVSSLRRKWVGAIGKAQNEGGVKGIETVTPLDQMKAAAYQVARDAVHGAADGVAAAADKPELVGALAKAKTNYSKLAELEKFAATLDRVNAGNRMVGLTDMIHMGQGPLSAAAQGLGAAIGSLAGPGGAIVGAHIGRVPGMAMDFLAKKWLEDKGLVYMSALAKRAAKEGPEVFSSVMASEGAKRLKATMSGVEDSIRNMAIRGLTSTSASGGSDHMRHLLGGTQGLSADQAYSKLGSRLTSLAANPESMAAATASASAPFAAASPQLGAAYQEQLQQTLAYLHDALPKPPAPAAPFEPDDWQPSEADKLAFHDKAEIVNNPMRAMYHVERGTLSDAHVDALQHIYPQILGQMRDTALQFAAGHPEVKLPAPERRSLSKLLGLPPDTVSSSLPALQASYTKPIQPSQQPGTPKPSKSRIKHMPSVASAFTASQGPSPTGA